MRCTVFITVIYAPCGSHREKGNLSYTLYNIVFGMCLIGRIIEISNTPFTLKKTSLGLYSSLLNNQSNVLKLILNYRVNTENKSVTQS